MSNLSSIRTNRDKGDRLENLVCESLKKICPDTYRTPNSGAIYGEDIHSSYVLIQCKNRDQKSFSINFDDYLKLKSQAYRRSRMAAFASENASGEVIISMPLDDWLEVMRGYNKAREVHRG